MEGAVLEGDVAHEHLVQDVLADATLFLPFILSDPPRPLSDELISAPIRERRRWLGSSASTSSSPSSTFLSPLHAPKDTDLEAIEPQLDAAIASFRHTAENAFSPVTPSSSASTSISRTVSPLLSHVQPRFRRPEAGVLLVAIQLQPPQDGSALTLLLWRDGGSLTDDRRRAPAFLFLNLLPHSIDELPGAWQNAATMHASSSSTSNQSPMDSGAEYHDDGDDFWAGVDSDSSSDAGGKPDRGKGKNAGAEDEDNDDAYWRQYDSVQGADQVDDDSRQSRPSPGQTVGAASDLPRSSVASGAASDDPLEEARYHLRAAWKAAGRVIPPTEPDAMEARRTLVFTMLAEAIET
ncbi:hypothetical protein V8E36_000676 [Tilletia maclaganii]